MANVIIPRFSPVAVPPAYLPELRTALRGKLAELQNAEDRARFYPMSIGVRSAFEDHLPKEIIRALISQVYIGIGGEDDDENRPDLRQLQDEMLSLPEWDL